MDLFPFVLLIVSNPGPRLGRAEHKRHRHKNPCEARAYNCRAKMPYFLFLQ